MTVRPRTHERVWTEPQAELVRALSRDLFNKEYLLETAMAVGHWDSTFSTDRALDEVRRLAGAVGVRRPSRAPVHDALKRLHRLVALGCKPPAAPRGEAYEWSVRSRSPFWKLLDELLGSSDVPERSPRASAQ